MAQWLYVGCPGGFSGGFLLGSNESPSIGPLNDFEPAQVIHIVVNRHPRALHPGVAAGAICCACNPDAQAGGKSGIAHPPAQRQCTREAMSAGQDGSDAPQCQRTAFPRLEVMLCVTLCSFSTQPPLDPTDAEQYQQGSHGYQAPGGRPEVAALLAIELS